jgi:hypothetical protein
MRDSNVTAGTQFLWEGHANPACPSSLLSPSDMASTDPTVAALGLAAILGDERRPGGSMERRHQPA